MEKFSFEDLLKIYKEYEIKYSQNAYKYISKVLEEAKPLHKKTFQGNDHEQSWRAFKGKNLEKLIVYVIENSVKGLELKLVDGNKIERINEKNLTNELATVKRNLLIDYNEFGYHLPDVDIIIYSPKTFKIVAVLSIKVTLRERIAQTGYWKLKLSLQNLTKHIKVYFLTPDEDKTLTDAKNIKKGRAIVEIDTDGAYILNSEKHINSHKVKDFRYFIDDLKKIIS